MVTAEQAALVDVSRKFLDTACSSTRIRELADDPDATARFWREGAALGWTSLLVSEADGGGCVSDSGLGDLTLIATEFGRHAAPGPLLAANLAAAALSRHGTADQKRQALGGLLDGSLIGTAWLGGGKASPVRATASAGGCRLSGHLTPVEAAADAGYFIVAAGTDAGTALFCVPASADGVTVEPLHSLDLTRRFGAVRLDDVDLPDSALMAGPPDGARAVAWLTDLACVVQAAEMAGAADRAFELAVDWALHRFSFGRTLASYQAIKHRYADMKTWLEACHAIAGSAARAVGEGGDDASRMASAAKAHVSHYGPEIVHECVQMLGGIGVTSDHDVHLYLRRVVVNVPIHGGVAEHHERVTALLQRGR